MKPASALTPPTTAPSLVAATWLHARNTMLSLIRWRRSWPAIALVVFLAATAGLLARYSPDDRMASADFFTAFGLISLATLSIGYGASSVRATAERGAVSLYLLRPNGNIAWPLGTWLATMAFTVSVGLLATGVVLVGAATTAIGADSGHILPMFLAAAATCATWTSIAMATAAHTRRGPALCAVWLFVVDAALARAVDSLAWLTPGPAARHLAQLPPEHLLLAPESTTAIAQICVIASVATAVLIARVYRDPPAR